MLSGWVKASSVDIRGSRKLRLRAKIYYTDGTTETHSANFLSSTDVWQFASVNIVPKKTLDVKAIRVCCDYDYNCNTAIFDNLSLIKDTVKSYTYDDDGNTVSVVDNTQNKSTFEYQDNDLVKQNNPSGYSYNYTYDSKHNLLTAKSENEVTYTFTYDSIGNPLTMKQANSAGDLYINSSATYTTNGNYLATLTDARGYTSNYTYNANSGLLTKFADALDNRTIYAYNLNNNRITSVAYDANKNGVGDGTESMVNYAYSKGRLSTITHNGFNYGFTYDNFGNMVTTTVGGTAFVTNTYGSNNGMLTKSAYGNGYNLLYTYDKFNRVIAEKQGSNALNRFYYDNNGNLATATDGENGIEYNYEYDFIGRLVRSFATKNSADYLTSQIKYDEINRITQQKYILADGTKHSYQYHYDNLKDNLLAGVSLPYSRNLAYTYDALNRPVSKILSGGTANISESYTYLSAGTNKTTSLISDITYSGGSKLSYEYDALNNIISVTDKSGKEITYAYDGLGQLVREDNPYTSKTYVYAYDKGGNITSVKTYAYTTSSTLGTPTSTVTYTYGDSTWKDKLTNYNGTAITYDSIGNPLSYRNGTLAWNGRQLKSHTSTSGTTTIYTYNSDGVRIGKKSVYQGNTSENSYVVSGTQILSETKGSTTNYYIYDEKGLPVGIVYNGTTYTYRKNLQGDIIAILDSTGAEVVTYTYNAWGAVEDIGGSLETTLGAKNPFRYRGYYYDTETGYYYLNSRYYDPVTGRFLNPEPNVDIGGFDSGAGLLGYNVYAYCANNPVMYKDENGEFLLTAIIVGAVAGAVIGGVIGGTAAYNSSKETGLEGADLFWATAEGIGKGVLIGGVAGTMVGTTVGAIGACGIGSVAATATLSCTATVAAKTTEVAVLQARKSGSEGKSAWQITDDCMDSIFNNSLGVVSPVATKAVTTGGAYFVEDMVHYTAIRLRFSAFLEHPMGKFSYVFPAYAWAHTGSSIVCEDPVKRAEERGYILK